MAHAAQAGRLEVEAPGREEDESRRPFVGAAGRFPDHVLEGAVDARADLFITNIVKCRPPKNRAPRVGEVDTCVSIYLFEQIEARVEEVAAMTASKLD